MASTSNAGFDDDDDDDEEGEANFSEHSSEDEGEEWLHMEFYSVKDIQDEVKSQYKKAMKKPALEDPVHKKIASYYKDNLKLHHMQLLSFHSEMKTLQSDVERTKEKTLSLFGERMQHC